jgi:hypothetical protein
MNILARLPKPSDLERLMKSLAVLDAIMSPEWEYRYYSYDVEWGAGENMGSIRNGSGDDVFVLFNKAGTFMKGFAHEYKIESASDDFYKDVPNEFAEATKEPAFTTENVSYCFWRKREDENWKYSVSPSTINNDVFFMLKDLVGDPKTYVEFCEDYYEENIDLKVVKAIYQHTPITENVAKALNADVDYLLLQEELTKMEYPFKS